MDQKTLSYIFSKIDHTLLSTTATKEDLALLCKEAEKAGAASVCVPPIFVSDAKKSLEYHGARRSFQRPVLTAHRRADVLPLGGYGIPEGAADAQLLACSHE